MPNQHRTTTPQVRLGGSGARAYARPRTYAFVRTSKCQYIQTYGHGCVSPRVMSGHASHLGKVATMPRRNHTRTRPQAVRTDVLTVPPYYPTGPGPASTYGHSVASGDYATGHGPTVLLDLPGVARYAEGHLPTVPTGRPTEEEARAILAGYLNRN